jgi:hypothetical protein
MYPIGLASPKEGVSQEEEFYFLMKEDICLGHEESREFTIREWIENQGVSKYDEMGREYKEITLHDFFEKGGQLNSSQMEMFYTACYDLDQFRRFVFESTFLKRFEIEKETVRAIEKDEEALLRFAFRWLRFCLFGEPTLKVKDDEIKDKKSKKKKKKR